MTLEFLLISILILLCSFFSTFLLTPYARKFAVKKRYSDKKDDRTVHTKQTTRLGGIAVFSGILFSFLVLLLLGKLQAEITALLAGAVLIFVIGLIDDIKDIRAHWKFLVQLAACIIIMLFGFRMNALTIPFSEISIRLPLILSYVLSIIWILLITNAVNFIDGLDGLAAGIMTIACVFLFSISVRTGRTDMAIPFLAIVGSCLGFLRHNFYPAKVFMGDAGSTTIGFTVGCLTLFGTIKAPAAFPLLIPIIALFIPVTDVALAVLRRMKKKESPFSPDKKHIHHKLLETGIDHKDAVLMLYGLTFILGVIALNFSPHPSVSTGGFALLSIGIILVAIKRIKTR